VSLIINEIHMLDGFRKTVLVFAADRRITKPDGSYTTKKKLFRIPYMKAAVSYFGVAEVRPRDRLQHLSDWLSGFINTHSGTRNLKDFAFQLREELNKVVPPQVLRKYASGFHICGYNSSGLPDLWFLTNIGHDLLPQYAQPTSDFLERDAKGLGWDGADLCSIRNAGWIYRNGDFRAHVIAWDRLGKILKKMLSFPDFKQPRTMKDYEAHVKFKLEVIAHMYRNFARRQTIGGPIDVFSLSKNLH
jgi:hypothetical protein